MHLRQGSVPLTLLFALVGGFIAMIVLFAFAWPQGAMVITPAGQKEEADATKEAVTVPPDTPPEAPKEIPLPPLVHLVVPFTSQAPFGEWADPRQQDACEEATTLMAMKWVRSEPITSAQSAKEELLALSSFQSEKYGETRDTSAEDTVERILNNYYSYPYTELRTNVTKEELIKELASGHLIIAPMNGQVLKNPHFTAPGPERHMVLLIGYDLASEEFITNDPGIRQGKDYRYPFSTFMGAIRDYKTGYHIPIVGTAKTVIVVKPQP